MVRCERGIFLREAIHQTSGLGVAWGQSSHVTSLGPLLASGAAADRSDVYSGSLNVKGSFPTELFTTGPLRPESSLGLQIKTN